MLSEQLNPFQMIKNRTVKLHSYYVTYFLRVNLPSELPEFQRTPCCKEAQCLKVTATKLEMHGSYYNTQYDKPL